MKRWKRAACIALCTAAVGSALPTAEGQSWGQQLQRWLHQNLPGCHTWGRAGILDLRGTSWKTWKRDGEIGLHSPMGKGFLPGMRYR